ncbi:hypothetical protein GGTG_09052 [Gaeumannomyces tritici R3-111a-1]|uniref:Enoyl reductase (ER) domain-containing protein n=1 Tax=Gaeumannomyces tritici (strain R3-111a-1) TaxID=644352 RepID=J3P6B1_GAET3|nr:hypothetical protein GGTG_09052 [Gaeumannomyces tritici R3-111a-1]EJT72185.1 hypothetical protein GGTG_09052 [Gaeumannomyces tritici R3-111a-1]
MSVRLSAIASRQHKLYDNHFYSVNTNHNKASYLTHLTAMASTTAVVPKDLPTEMQAILQPDKASTKLVQGTIPVPTPTHPDDILVRVVATAPCAGELLWARNFPELIPADKIPVPGQDMAGIVVAAPQHSTFKPGDEVYARIEATRPGAAAEYTLAKESELALRPRSVDWAHTAATPLSALTAYQALFTHGTLNPAALLGGHNISSDKAAAVRANGQQRVLVTGASGGVGSWVVQLAAAAGAGAVVAVAGPGKGDLVRELGATEVVDYSRQTIGQWAAEGSGGEHGVDLVVDCIGGTSLAASWAAVKDGGLIVSIVSSPEAARPAGGQAGNSAKAAKGLFFVVEALGSQLKDIARLVDAKVARPLVDSVWGFNEFEKAFGRLEGGHVRGKIVMQVDGSLE